MYCKLNYLCFYEIEIINSTVEEFDNILNKLEIKDKFIFNLDKLIPMPKNKLLKYINDEIYNCLFYYNYIMLNDEFFKYIDYDRKKRFDKFLNNIVENNIEDNKYIKRGKQLNEKYKKYGCIWENDWKYLHWGIDYCPKDVIVDMSKRKLYFTTFGFIIGSAFQKLSEIFNVDVEINVYKNRYNKESLVCNCSYKKK